MALAVGSQNVQTLPTAVVAAPLGRVARSRFFPQGILTLGWPFAAVVPVELVAAVSEASLFSQVDNSLSGVDEHQVNDMRQFARRQPN